MYDDFCEAADAVLDQTYDDVELVVVVDGNDFLFEKVLKGYSQRDDVTLHCNDENVGLLESRNKGAELAMSDIVAFIDDDAVADERWIAELVSSYEEQDALAVGGKMVGEWIAGKPSYLPAEFYWLVGVTHRGFADGPGYVRNTFGSNLSFRRDTFHELGGFDTDIGGRKGEKNLQGGETELCARLNEKFGEHVWYNPNAIVAHKVFSYRIDPVWLIERAFWQGYSKRVMEKLVAEAGDEENEFLRRLLTCFVPTRIHGILKDPSRPKLVQLVSLLVFTVLVGAGYLYGGIST